MEQILGGWAKQMKVNEIGFCNCGVACETKLDGAT